MIMWHMHFWELHMMEEKMRAAREAKINQMKAEKYLLSASMMKNKKMVIWVLHQFEIWFHL